MKFLEYTKKLKSEVSKYDKLAKNPFTQKGVSNPFTKPCDIKLIWIEPCDLD